MSRPINASNTPAMPLTEAHLGGLFVSGGCTGLLFGYNCLNNTRQGYARKSTLKPAGYLFLGV